ncbi:hypothetical protein LSH36_214g05005 [Paralvinella palmiformis]|uniref:I/LWEQ domain-containing protein n=1 Tax=Paralvinella palmiformis TaxID=53620 RepID=A0AAD9N644_9ANNE|nr:hypothetical protein LSH36_214g05005 [Paralvinella palmiformis]
MRKNKEETENGYKQEQEQHKEAKEKIMELTSRLDTSKSSESELSTKLQAVTEELNKFQTKSQDLAEQLATLEQARASLDDSLRQSQTALGQKQQDLEQSKSDKDILEQTLKKEILDYRNHMLVSAVEEAESIIREALAQAENPHITTITCTAEYLMDRATPVLETISQLKHNIETYTQDPQAISEVVTSVSEFSHRLADVIVFGFATSHAAPIEEGDALSGECRTCGEGSLELLTDIKQASYDKVPSKADNIDQLVKRILSHAEALLPKVEDVKAEQMGDMVDQEMQQTTEAIAQAAEKIASMLAHNREKYTGIQLQVNEGILDSCNALMRAILKLVEKSKNLQREIVSQGRV